MLQLLADRDVAATLQQESPAKQINLAWSVDDLGLKGAVMETTAELTHMQQPETLRCTMDCHAEFFLCRTNRAYWSITTSVLLADLGAEILNIEVKATVSVGVQRPEVPSFCW